MWLLWRSFENFCACGMGKCQVLLTGAGTWIGCAVWYEWQVEAFLWKIKPLIITQRYMYSSFMWWILKSAGFSKIEIASQKTQQKTQDTDVRVESWVLSLEARLSQNLLLDNTISNKNKLYQHIKPSITTVTNNNKTLLKLINFPSSNLKCNNLLWNDDKLHLKT